MTELFEPTSERDRRLVTGAAGLLGAFNVAGVVEASDVHVAARLGSLGGEPDESVLLAVALTVRAVRRGSVCLDLATVPALDPALPWPEPAAWAQAVAASPLTTAGVVRLDHGLLYLDRYHRLESQVCDDLVARAQQDAPAVDEASLAAALERLRDPHFSDEQRDAAVRAVRQWTTVLTGGPGTGKTSTVARILALLADQARANDERISIALAAPTGKAAARLQDAVAEAVAGLDPDDREWVARTDAMTLHRLLGWRPDNRTRFRHDRTNRLKYDVVVVDESSMVELTMMARLLDAVRLRSRLVLLGDPRQLTSVGAGAVLSDLVAGYDGDPASPVASLLVNHRSVADIQTLAEALRAGDADGVLTALRAHSEHVDFVETDDAESALRDDAVAAALDIRAAAVAGDAEAAVAALDRHRLLCAHREGPFGVRRWNTQIERWLGEALGQSIYTDWYAGRPILVTTNDHTLEVYNGETGVAVLEEGRLRAYIAGAGGLKGFAPGRLDAIETMHAMTIHKSQGSQADRVTVLLPEAGSRLLTRELFYTAVTRAQRHVRVVGSEAAVRAAVETQAQRATGLRQRLRNRGATPPG
ncbi:RecBCD enzyme subunit RecD [Nocardioides szechwanensis]|uniref:RecBCD enzyme subunit RecD n=1 Tax=Nocardioides szechwanensis TaxID=1005944 RepID=A0A1H0CRX5_9ACTN|nr:exodeoxyribonuclease V subunit alpha [Nocardioides szechwanensis]GEP33346.1 RecBCD enzyme subunit RecD [Nocardioides szechwanensis]SDN60628.1 DNA helicase/exodeoxyribonuclease V, alpha subunit [Nocardioides szechwanensis]